MKNFQIQIRNFFINLCASAPLHDMIEIILCSLPLPCNYRRNQSCHWFLLFTTYLLLLASYSHSTILTVKQDGTGDFTRIQHAINAASVNDTILVWPGTYFENISFYGKDLVLASLFLATGNKQYITQTIIDGNKSGSVVILQNNESLASLICGFTIQNGKKDFSSYLKEDYGCGIAVYYSNAMISNNIIQHNEAYAGGGVYCSHGTIKL